MAIDNKDKKVLNVPHLRFPEFSGEWDSERLENLTVSIGDGLHSTPVYCEQGDYCFINGNNIIDGKVSINEKTLRVTKEEAYKYNAALLKVDTILMSINGTIGNVALYNGENIMLGKSACYINPSSRIVREYLFHILSSPRIQAYFQGEVTGTTIKNLSLRTIRGSKILLPSNEEQKKIARLFSLVDERIATQNKIIEDLKKLKSAIIHCCYSSKTDMVSLSELLKQCSERNRSATDLQVLSVNNKYGFIAQSDQFEDREVASDDTTNYKVVEKGMFAYNPARINVGSIALYEMDGKGIVSPMYVCFTTKRTLLPGYLKHYFASQTFRHEMFKRLEGSVRLCLTFDSLCNIEIPLPSIELQENVGKYLSTIERKISLEESMLSQYQLQRSYLLSQMFI